MRDRRSHNGVTADLAVDIASIERIAAISDAITAMRQELGAPHPLRDIARTALMSPFHFHRVFRQITAATPGRFLTAMRMAEAKRLLLETGLSANDISFAVGYSSVGTFTTQFARLVGVPPGRFRAIAQPIRDVCMAALVERSPAGAGDTVAASGSLGARPDGSAGITFVATFAAGMPQGRPLHCTIATGAGPLRLPDPDPGGEAAGVLAVSVRQEATVGQVLAGDPTAGVFVGSATADGYRYRVSLREPRLTDPPLLLAYPLVIGGQTEPDRRWTR